MVDPSAPGGSVKLSAPLVSGGNVYDFALSPDGKSVTYIADQDIDTRDELYRVSLATPRVATKLNPQLQTNRDVMDFLQTPDGGRIVYRADGPTIGLYDLYIVDLASPGAATKLSCAMTPGGSVRSGYTISPDGTHAAYIATQDDLAIYELYEVAFDAPAVSTKLSAPMAGGGLWQFEYSEDSASATYSAEQDRTDPELYRVEVAHPGAATKLNSTIATGGGVWAFIVKAGTIQTP
jgi:Tol biopolymer transport system component